MTITRKSLADTIDAFDDEIAALQESKRETYAEYRAELAERMGKDEVRAEIDATKAAIKRRRAVREKGEETVEHKDALTDEIFAEIATGTINANVRVARGARTEDDPADRDARRRTRLSESMLDNKQLSAEMLRDGLISPEAHAENVVIADGVARKLGAGVIDPETGEIIEDNEPAPPAKPEGSGGPDEEGAGKAADALLVDTESTAPVKERAHEAGDAFGESLNESAQAVRDTGAGTQAPPVDTHSVAPPAADTEGLPALTAEVAPLAASASNSKPVPGSVRTERTPPVGLVWHDALRCFPEYWSKQLADFIEDVKANGIRVPVVMQRNVVIDGRARYNAARHLLIEYPVEEYAGDDPLRDIIRLNMASRSLNLVERQNVAKKLIKLVPDRADEIAELLDLSQQREAAQ